MFGFCLATLLVRPYLCSAERLSILGPFLPLLLMISVTVSVAACWSVLRPLLQVLSLEWSDLHCLICAKKCFSILLHWCSENGSKLCQCSITKSGLTVVVISNDLKNARVSVRFSWQRNGSPSYLSLAMVKWLKEEASLQFARSGLTSITKKLSYHH